MEAPLSPETLAAQAMGAVDSETGALVPPLHTATTYEMHPDGSLTDGRAYTRADNPTYDPAEQLINTLEGGAGCILFASGNAAATAVFQALLPGDHVLVSRILYWGIRKWLAEFAVTWGLDVEFVDVTDLEACKPPFVPASPACCGWRHRPIRRGKLPTSPPPPRSRTPRRSAWRWTTRCRRRC